MYTVIKIVLVIKESRARALCWFCSGSNPQVFPGSVLCICSRMLVLLCRISLVRQESLIRIVIQRCCYVVFQPRSEECDICVLHKHVLWQIELTKSAAPFSSRSSLEAIHLSPWGHQRRCWKCDDLPSLPTSEPRFLCILNWSPCFCDPLHQANTAHSDVVPPIVLCRKRRRIKKRWHNGAVRNIFKRRCEGLFTPLRHEGVSL